MLWSLNFFLNILEFPNFFVTKSSDLSTKVVVTSPIRTSNRLPFQNQNISILFFWPNKSKKGKIEVGFNDLVRSDQTNNLKPKFCFVFQSLYYINGCKSGLLSFWIYSVFFRIQLETIKVLFQPHRWNLNEQSEHLYRGD